MEDIFFTDAGEAPVPPDEVRIRTLEAEPRGDGARVAVRTALTPFQRRPNLELSIHNSAGDEISSLSVVEAIDPSMDFTMHLRGAQSEGDFELRMVVFYSNLDEFEAEEGADSSGDVLEHAKEVVDSRTLTFQI